jgi:hypothetical protein
VKAGRSGLQAHRAEDAAAGDGRTGPAFTVAGGTGEWVIFRGDGARVTSFHALASAVRRVVKLLEGAFGPLEARS